MTRPEHPCAAIVLAVHDVEETRDGIEKLLTADGYRVEPARNEDDAVERARRQPPDLILISPGAAPGDIVTTAMRIRQRAGLPETVPIVVFCVVTIDEGAEVAIGNDVYLTRPDSFNQLRVLLARLVRPGRPDNIHTRSPRAPRDRES